MNSNDTKVKKTKKSGLEIRFTVSENDGNLKEMLDKVPNGCYTDFTKAALRYYLKAVRDKEVECDFLKSGALDEFRVDLKQQEPRLEDILRVIQACSNNKVETYSTTTISTNATNNQNLEDKNTGISENNEICDTLDEDEDIDYDLQIEVTEDEEDRNVVEESSPIITTGFTF